MKQGAGQGGWRRAAMLLVIVQSPADPASTMLCRMPALAYAAPAVATAMVASCGPERVFSQGFDK